MSSVAAKGKKKTNKKDHVIIVVMTFNHPSPFKEQMGKNKAGLLFARQCIEAYTENVKKIKIPVKNGEQHD